MKPLVTHVHVIPLEDRPGLLHCAQQNCWCFPSVDAEDSRLLTHNAITSASEGWIKIAENRQHSHSGAQPVRVSERLPGPEDCDAEGRCWLLTVEDEYPQWRLHSIEGSQPGGDTMIWVPVDSSPGVMVDCFYTSHWLPAHALPIPEQGDH